MHRLQSIEILDHLSVLLELVKDSRRCVRPLSDDRSFRPPKILYRAQRRGASARSSCSDSGGMNQFEVPSNDDLHSQMLVLVRMRF